MRQVIVLNGRDRVDQARDGARDQQRGGSDREAVGGGRVVEPDVGKVTSRKTRHSLAPRSRAAAIIFARTAARLTRETVNAKGNAQSRCPIATVIQDGLSARTLIAREFIVINQMTIVLLAGIMRRRRPLARHSPGIEDWRRHRDPSDTRLACRGAE
jgi:hypothetical protein